MRKMLGIIIVAVCTFINQVQAADMTAQEISKKITNSRILLETSFGIEFPLFYSANGTVTGDGTGTALGNYVAPKETGKWWLKDNKLCQQFPTWNKRKVTCFRLEDVGGNNLIWKRDDGKSGRAKID